MFKIVVMSKRGKREFDARERNKVADREYVGELDRIDERRFTREMTQLIDESEEMRLHRMKQYRARSFVSMTVNIISMLAGVCAFGWFFMMEAQIFRPFIYFALSFLPGILLGFWTKQPKAQYIRDHKEIFMPKMAKALNGLSYYPSRGVSSKTFKNLGVVPSYDRYDAEDCFMGTYKGVKVIFSEARLYSRSHKDGPVFDGIFVLLETPEDICEGHTIITADELMAKTYPSTRWKKLSPVDIMVSDPKWDKFSVYSSTPDNAAKVVNDRLIKELAEASDVFDKSPLTAVMFKKKYIFMMVPYSNDMFEASNMFIPVTTKEQALRCKKEIEQLLEIIDVFDIYQKPE